MAEPPRNVGWVAAMAASTISIIHIADSIAKTLYPTMDLNTIKDQVGNLSSEATIATFLAGVQSQIIALSYQDNSTKIKVATNVLGFAGVLLDVSATCFALLTSTVLQRYIAIVEKQLGAIDNELTDIELYLTMSPQSTLPLDIIRRVLTKMKERIRLVALEQADTQGVSPDEQSGRLAEVPELDIKVIEESFTGIQNVVPAGEAAEASLLYGVICFFASVLCLAISTQPRVVWIISVVVCASTILFSSVFSTPL
ncbi:hypothetical protein DFH09DRAFT_1355622 [Mycena vulgaris]|nr:hypothetical protein DFH09DRAFT_1355622 [Mycena vulgaris]